VQLFYKLAINTLLNLMQSAQHFLFSVFKFTFKKILKYSTQLREK